MSRGLLEIAEERQRQIESEGWSERHDDGYTAGQLAYAAVCYADPASSQHKRPEKWPWTWSWWKPGTDRRRQLVKAGALIVAELDRLERAEARAGAES